MTEVVGPLAAVAQRLHVDAEQLSWKAERVVIVRDTITVDGGISATLETPAMTAQAPLVRWRLTADRLVHSPDSTSFVGLRAESATVTGTLRVEVATLTVDADGAWRAEDVVFSGLARGPLRAKRIDVEVDGTLTLHDAKVVPCGCDGDSALRLSAERIVVPATSQPELRVGAPAEGGRTWADERVVVLEGVALESALGTLPVPVDAVHEDGRASGMLPPRVGYRGGRGLELELPLYLRLGRSADVLASPGWATQLGPTWAAQGRLHWADDLRAELSTRGGYGLEGGDLDVQANAIVAMRLVEHARLVAVSDFVGNPDQRNTWVRPLRIRATSWGRSAATLGWDAADLRLDAGVEILQSFPSAWAWQRAGLRPGVFAPFPAQMPDSQRLPVLRFGTTLAPVSWLIVDVDAAYTRVQSLGGARFADWGATPQSSPLGLGQGPSLGAGDGERDLGEPLTRLDATRLRGAISLPLDLGGVAQLVTSVAVDQSYGTGERDDGRPGFTLATRASASTQLSTSLARRDGETVHLLQPRLAWRSSLFERTEDRLGAEAVTNLSRRVGMPDVLEGALGSLWFRAGGDAQIWVRQGISLEGVRLQPRTPTGPDVADEPGVFAQHVAYYALDSSLSVARLGRAWLRLGGDWRHLEAPSLAVGGERRVGGQWWLGASHRRVADHDPYVHGPAASVRSDTWFAAAERFAAPSAGDLSAFYLARSGPGWDLRAEAAVVWQQEPTAELALGVGVVGSCGCWRVGLETARRAVAPRYEALLSFTLLPDPGSRTP